MSQSTAQQSKRVRSKQITPTIIHCHNHGPQKTYLLYITNNGQESSEVSGIGCCKCFFNLNVSNRVVIPPKKYEDISLKSSLLKEVREAFEEKPNDGWCREFNERFLELLKNMEEA